MASMHKTPGPAAYTPSLPKKQINTTSLNRFKFVHGFPS